MRISDEERREIADGLRRLADGCHNTGVPDSEILDVLEIRRTNIPDFSDAYDVEVLADLIDRPTCHLVEDEDGRTACSECGCAALCLLDATYCPDCGCVITDD